MSTAAQGPFLYDDGPTSPHTGTPRSGNRLLLGIMLATVAVGVAMVLLLPVVKGTASEQATSAVTVFYASMADGDDATAIGMLCETERGRLDDTHPAGDYRGGTEPEISGTERGEVDGDTVQYVSVRFADGTTATVTVVNEDGPRVCGIAA